VAESHALTVAEPHALTVAEPDALTVAEPHASTVAESHALTVAESDASTVAESDASTVAESHALTVAEPHALTVAEPDANEFPSLTECEPLTYILASARSSSATPISSSATDARELTHAKLSVTTSSRSAMVSAFSNFLNSPEQASWDLPKSISFVCRSLKFIVCVVLVPDKCTHYFSFNNHS
jgi:hypothetical protein